MLDGERTPATRRCNISLCASHRFRCESGNTSEVGGKDEIAVEIIKMWSLSPFRKYPRRTNCFRTDRGLVGYISSWLGARMLKS